MTSKPLPDIPSQPLLTTLTVESREHRARFIRYILDDLSVEITREEWTTAFEDALDQLSQSVAQGNWLIGVKRGRELRRKNLKEDKTENEIGSTQLTEGEGSQFSYDTRSSRMSGRMRKALTQLRELTSKLSLPSPLPLSKHVLLCLAPPGSTIIPSEDSGFDMVPANIACQFNASTFLVPENDDNMGRAQLLYGFDEWDADMNSTNVRIVGGTFLLKGVISPIQHHLLAKALRLSIYTHLSLLLEQHLLSDFHVPLIFPRPQLSPSAFSASSVVSIPESQKQPLRARHTSFLPNRFFSFLNKKNPPKALQTATRGGSLDIDRTIRRQESTQADTGTTRARRFSFISDVRPSFLRSPQSQTDNESPLSAAVRRIRESKDLLSTSPGSIFPLPSLLVELAGLEKECSTPFRLKGDEWTGLGSILGWEGRESKGAGMTGMAGFIRHQEISMLVSTHIPPTSSSWSSSTSDVSFISSASSSEISSCTTCASPAWKTYRYFSSDEDSSLGEVITSLSDNADAPCDVKGCQFKQGKHRRRYIHGEVQICFQTTESDVMSSNSDTDLIETWESCDDCGAETERLPLNYGASLISFGKFLELLVYSPQICKIEPSLCQHTAISHTTTLSGLPTSRLNIIRSFAYHSHITSIRLSLVGAIFDLRVPRLQLVRGDDQNKQARSKDSSMNKKDSEEQDAEDKRVLRREIKAWWECIGSHLDKLEDVLETGDPSSFKKALPRLPSSDDAYDDFDLGVKYTSTTIRQTNLVGLPPLPNLSPSGHQNLSSTVDTPSESALETPTQVPGRRRGSFSSRSPDLTTRNKLIPELPHMELLSSLRYAFHRTEQALYAQIAQTSSSSLNDVRRTFFSAARGAERRLQAWKEKHLSNIEKEKIPVLEATEPEWWDNSCHVVPGGNIIVRESDWGSIIAFTMSTTAYSNEMSLMLVARSISSASESLPPATPTSSSFFSSAAGYRIFRSSALSQPDPDQDDVIWHEPEAYSAVITRKEHPRDPTGLLSLRDVLRQKSSIGEGSDSTLSPSRYTNMGITNSRTGGSPTPPSAWSKPDVGISMQSVDGEVGGLPDSAIEKILQELDTAGFVGGEPSSKPPSAMSWNHHFGDAHIRRGKTSSILLAKSDSEESDVTIGPEESPIPVAKDTIKAPAPTASSFASFTGGITHVMKYMLSSGDAERIGRDTSSHSHHGLLSAEHHIDDRPHIKYDWTIGKRLKFSCTVYYAKQFDALRRRCGVDEVFLKSLSKSANWTAEGGKSKSNFWKTSDDRFIIKTLVNAWNVADLQVLIELAPSYFKYMDSTASKATVLAKLAGFYTIEIRNLETGAVQSKADLLVMENLFFSRNISKAYDLKGIQGRKVKPNVANARRTLFDADWIEDQQRALTLIRPHSKLVLMEAVKNDAEFLARSNIMDYSLLVGVDEESKQIACGLVDTIGSYTFAKTLEYKAKQGLNAGKDVTVIPPAEYQERFTKALDSYFLACPDKWSRRMDEGRPNSDPNFLPSVL